MENYFANKKNLKMRAVLLAGLIGISFCADDDINGLGNIVISGRDNKVNGKQNTLDGFRNVIEGSFNDINGDQNDIKGDSNFVDGNGNIVIGSDNFVMGEGNMIEDSLNVRIDPNWVKNLKTQFDINDLQESMFSEDANPNFDFKPLNQYEKQIGQKMQREIEERLKNQGMFNNPALERLRQIGNRKQEM